MEDNRFYICEDCGNIIGMIYDAGMPVMCCGKKMQKMQAGKVDASKEKHVPIVKIDGNSVEIKIGSSAHPMEEEHSIQWVYLRTDKGGHRRSLAVNEKPELEFILSDEKAVAAYAYCNKHGLWKTDVE